MGGLRIGRLGLEPRISTGMALVTNKVSTLLIPLKV